MLIVRAPLRITLGGGGTDLPAYYKEYGGFCIAAAIDKYVYVTVTRPFRPGIYLKYSEIEHVEKAEDIRHPGFRKALVQWSPPCVQFEATTLADIPAGTGLGSSGSFAVALTKAIHAGGRSYLTTAELAEYACEIEDGGKQDPYVAAYGGVNFFEFKSNGSADVWPGRISVDTLNDLEDNLLLFFTGVTRSAGDALKGQGAMTENLHKVKEAGYAAKEALEAGNTRAFGYLLNVQWSLKQERSPASQQIADWRRLGISNGALGGKLVGAGGGGFLLFYTRNRVLLRKAMREAGLEEVRFRFDFEGAKVLVS